MTAILPRYVYDSGAGNVIIDFTACIAQDPKESVKANRKIAFGGTGIRQVNHKYNEIIHTLKHQFITEAEIDAVSTMMRTWTLLGNSFDFYEDQTITGSFITVEVIDSQFKPSLMNKANDIWEFTIRVREEIT